MMTFVAVVGVGVGLVLVIIASRAVNAADPSQRDGGGPDILPVPNTCDGDGGGD